MVLPGDKQGDNQGTNQGAEMMKKMTDFSFTLLFSFLFFGACAQGPEKPVSLTDKAPQLLYVVPGAGELLSTQPQFAILFSEPIDESTLTAESILLSQGDPPIDKYKNSADLYKAIDRGDLSGASLKFSVREEGKVVIAATDDELDPNTSYSLIVTSRVMSRDHIPLKKMQEGQDLLLLHYQTADRTFVQPVNTILGGEATPASNPPANPPADPANRADVAPVPPVTTDIHPPSPDQVPVATHLVLNEIYYDAVGSDTDGVLFVELYGTPGLDISHYRINFVNGSDGKIYDAITLPGSAHVAPDGFYVIADSQTGSPTLTHVGRADLVDNFDPQNGPDAVQLLDATGHLVDAVGYGAGVVPIAENGLASYQGQLAPDVVNGHSLERRGAGLDTGNNQNDFADRETPTPGR